MITHALLKTYILFDTLFDVKFSVIKLNSNSFITDSYSLESTDLYGDFKECRRISIFEDFDEYFSYGKSILMIFSSV